ncbi:MAG: hypothetical protein FJ306_12300 [Planctomycetes bacterium]|nr:hypothetical protein [Planctomycetota bacterium]
MRPRKSQRRPDRCCRQWPRPARRSRSHNPRSSCRWSPQWPCRRRRRRPSTCRHRWRRHRSPANPQRSTPSTWPRSSVCVRRSR